jgi:FecR-like protein
MSVFNRFSTTDRIILSGSTAVLLLLSYLLYDDSLLFPPDTNTESAIGVISISANDVRRKNSGNFVWLPGNKQDQIYNRDSIFTGDGSQAAIQLNDGSLIQIQENSLVNLNLKNGQMELDLRFGQFVGKGNSTIRVKTGDDEYTIQGKDAQFEINRSHAGALDVKVLSGNAEISSKAGKENLKSNESLQISKKGAEKNQVDAKITLLTKEDSLMYRAADKQPIAFAWEGKGPLSQYQIEIAKTEDFKKILALRTTPDQKIAVKDSLKEGPYFWRVKGLDERRRTLASSAVQKFYLSYMQPPTITSPADQTTLKNKALDGGDGLQASTQINWTADELPVRYQWQLSKAPEFTENLAEKTLTEKTITTPNLYQGTYYTRVRGFDKDNHPSPWSKTHTFNFEVTSEKKPPAPRLVEKRIRFQMPKLEERAPSAASSPQLAWTTVDAAKTYHWDIAKNARFVGATSAETPSTKVAWTQYKPGKYYFRVFAKTDLGQSSDASETGTLEVYGDAPVLNAFPSILIKSDDIRATAPAKEARANWSSIPEAKTYLVQVDKSEEFANPTQMEVPATESSVSLPEPGKYFVRVKALNESSQDMSEFSNTQTVDYVFKHTLKAPELIEPYDKTTIFLQKDMEPLIWLEWNPVPDTPKYQLEVSSKPDFSNVVISKTMTNTRFLVKEKIPYGAIYWRVKAIHEDDSLSSSWSTRQFMFIHQRNDGF